MKKNLKLFSRSAILALCVTSLAGCRIPAEDSEDSSSEEVLYQTY